MTREPQNRRFTQDEYAMLADIFRVMLREVTTEADKDKLAPGELAINYKSGEFWIRSPYTGKLFSPNSVERIKVLARKLIPGTTDFNAEYVRGIRFYTDLIELDKLNTAFTPDSVIRQMHAPAILMAKAKYDNNDVLGWPAKSGTVLCVKIHEEAVVIRYYPDNMNVTYAGQYNVDKHMFEGWSTADGSPDDFQTNTEGSGTHININLPQQVNKDLTIVYVTVDRDIHPGADLSVNGLDPKPIIGIDGKPLAHEIVENTSIMLIYDSARDAWVYLDRTETAMTAIMKIVLERVANTDATLKHEVGTQLTRLENTIKETETAMTEKHDQDMAALQESISTQIQNLSDGFDQDLIAIRKSIQALSDEHNSEVAALSQRIQMLESANAALAQRVKKLEDNMFIMDLD